MKKTYIIGILTAFSSFAFALSSGAATFYWDANAEGSPSLGGAGDWNAGNANWRDGSETGALTTWVNNSSVALVAPSTIQLKYWAGAVVQDIYVSGGSSGIYNAAKLSFMAGSVIDVANDSILNFSLADLSGSNGYTKTGDGVLNLWANLTTFTGTVIHDGGTLQLRVADAIGTSGNLVVQDGKLLQLFNDVSTTFGSENANSVSIESDTTALNFQVGRLSSGAGVTHTIGALSLGERTVNVSAYRTTSGTSGLISGATTLTGHSTLNIASSTTMRLGALSGSYSLTKTGVGELLLDGAENTATGNLILQEGTTTLAAGEAMSFASGVSLGSSGGAALLAVNGQNVTFAEALILVFDATIDFSGTDASTLVFGDSSGESWTGYLYLTNFNGDEDSLRFGLTASGLASEQLGKIVWVGLGEGGTDIIGAAINSEGYLTAAIPEVSSLSWLIVVLAGAGWSLLKRRRAGYAR